MDDIKEIFNRAFKLLNSKNLKDTDVDYYSSFEVDPNYHKFQFEANSNEDYHRAIELFTEVINVKPYHKLSYNFRGIAKRRLKDFDGALADFLNSIGNDPLGLDSDRIYVENYRDRGDFMYSLKDYKGAIEEYSRAIEIHDPFSEYSIYHNRGRAKHLLNDFNGAIADYTRTIEINANFSNAYFNRGFARFSLKDFEGTIEDFSKSISFDPENAINYHNRGCAKFNIKDYEGAIDDFSKSITIDPDYISAYNLRGQARETLNDWKGAIEDFTKATEIDPNYSINYFSRGTAKLYNEDFEGAINDFSKSISFDPDDAINYHNRGLAKTFIEDYENAIKDFSKSIALDPGYVSAYELRGRTNGLIGNWEGAIEDFTKIIELDPNNDEAIDNLQVAKKELEKLREIDRVVFTPDADNKEFFQAYELIKNGNPITYVTGKAGTGKSTLVKYIRDHINKNIAVVAPTGVAAVNVNGQTIFSFFKINYKEAYIPGDQRLQFQYEKDDPEKVCIYSHFRYSESRLEIMKNLDILIIDEISMVRADLLDVIDKLLRAFSGKGRKKPFGGVQVVLLGDPFQLPPIEDDPWQILQHYYESPFFFDAHIFKDRFPIYIELKKIYSTTDEQFIEMLNRVRINETSDDDFDLLNDKLENIEEEHFEDGYVVLCSTNSQVSQINEEMLSSLDTEGRSFMGIIEGEFDTKLADNITPINLFLKESAQIMFLKNSTNFYNGEIGKIKSLGDNCIVAEKQNKDESLVTFEIQKATWENIEYFFNEEKSRIDYKVIGTYTQYPIKIAYALTVYKSQGLRFDHVFININNFSPSGHVYVALSRCTSREGIKLALPLSSSNITVDPRIVEFAEKVTPEVLVIENIENAKADNLYKEALIAFKNKEYNYAYDLCVEGIMLRNDLTQDKFRRFILNQFYKKDFYQYLLNTPKTELDEDDDGGFNDDYIPSLEDIERDNFDAMTDGQYGDYDDDNPERSYYDDWYYYD